MPRSLVARWNLIPGWNGTISITPAEREEGIRELENLLPLFPALRSVVLVGAQAARAAGEVGRLGDFRCFVCAHPSMRVKNSPHSHVREAWCQIPQIWREAAEHAVS